MSLPLEHRDEIRTLARRWQEVAARRQRTLRINAAATAVILACGGPLLAFPDFFASSAWLVVPTTGGFLWGGWYKLYNVRSVHRLIAAEEAEINARLAALCGPGAAFSGDGTVVALDRLDHDPFSADAYA